VRSLFRRRRPQPVERPWVEVSCGGEHELEVHGESFHQPLIRALVDMSEPEINGDRIGATFIVAVCTEPKNTHDANAVAVRTLTGDALGHIPRDLARGYAEVLARAEQHFRICCSARAYGRRIGRDWNIGIWLAMPEAEPLATILHEAIGNVKAVGPGGVLAHRELPD
jgi:hypothetical protein